jgi:hypothetical protein
MTNAGLDTQPSALVYELDDLVQLAWSGRVRVPHFQRDFRWNTDDVVRLFDSIIRGYPIGSLLLWARRSPADHITLGALDIDAPEGDGILWVVDGQQRVISLANALHVDGYGHSIFGVAYDLATGSFVPRPKLAEPRYLPLPVLFDLDKLLEWFHNPESANTEYFAEARRVAKLLRQFKIPATLVRQDDEAALTDIFDRLNNYGKRLSRAEIFSALFAGPEASAKDRLSIPRIAQHVAAQTGFGTIDANTVLHAILARRGPDPTRDIRSEFDDKGRRNEPEFPREDQATAYSEGEKALIGAVRFLQEDAGVPHLSLLTYKALLVVITRFFAHFPEPKSRNVQLLRRTYWRVAISGPAVFKGSFTQMSRALCALIMPGDEAGSVDNLARSMQVAAPVLPNLERFRTNEATGKIILCSWWDLRPRSPRTTRQFNSSELYDLLADETTAALAVRRIVRGLDQSKQLWASNRIFVPSISESADTVLEDLSQQPIDVDDLAWDIILESFCLNRKIVEALQHGHRDEFLAARQLKVTQCLADFLSRMAEWDLEDTPALSSLDLDEMDDLPDGTE